MKQFIFTRISLILLVLAILSSGVITAGSSAASSSTMASSGTGGCDDVTCQYCCIEYKANVYTCANDILHCKLKKRDSFADLVLMLYLLGSIAVGNRR